MKKKLNVRLTLNKETLRALTPVDMGGVQGGIHTDYCTTITSNNTDTCDSCRAMCTNWCTQYC